MIESLALHTDAPRMAPLGRVPVLGVALLTAMGGLAWAWLVIAGADRGPFEVAVCAAPALLALALAFTSQDDRQQYVARLLACAAMLPILLMMWAGSQEAVGMPALAALAQRPWIFFSVFALLHAALFVAAVLWLARSVTRIEAMRGAAAVPANVLVQRLQALAKAGVPFDLVRGEAEGVWVAQLHLRANEDRSHRVIFDIDETAMTVHVRERLGASGAAPVDAGEASLRSIGDPAFEPARPDAQRVWSFHAQTTMIVPAQLAATRLTLRDALAEPGPDAVVATTADADALVTLLCALVTRSGYAWQPLMGIGRSR